MKIFTFLIILPIFSFSQNAFDSKIYVSGLDTTNLRSVIITNFARAGYLVLQDNRPDTVTTYPRYIKPLGYVQIQVILKDDVAVFFGFFRRKAANANGLTVPSSQREPILYYKGNTGKGWKILKQFADILKGELSYGKNDRK